MEQTKYLIIGASAAGMAAAHTIQPHDPESLITLITEEIHDPYFRPMIPLLISGTKKIHDMKMEGCGPYTMPNIRVKTGVRVVAVMPEQRRVIFESGETERYTKILFATGSSSYIPRNIDGIDAKGVFALRTLTDAQSMKIRADQTRHAVLVGGGLLNFKTAFPLLEKNIKVTLIVNSPQILSRLMEPQDTLFLRQALHKAGLEIETGVSVKAVESTSEKGVTGVILDDDRLIPCQMVCIGKGVRPNVDYLEGSGILVDDGIVADTYTACNLEDSFTAGDVAAIHDSVSGKSFMTGLWTHAVEMGKAAGLNMIGIKTAYNGNVSILNATQIGDIPFVSMGCVHTQASDFEVHCQVAGRRLGDAYRKMVFSADGKYLIGMVLVGDISNAGIYRNVIENRLQVTQFKKHIIDHTLHAGHFIR